MFPKLKLSVCLLRRLERIKQQCSGCLFGVFYGDGTLLLLCFNVESSIGQMNYEQTQHKFPAEVDLCGLVKFGDCSDSEAHLREVFQDVAITDNPIQLHCQLGTLVGMRASIFLHEKLQEVPFEVMDTEQLYTDFCFTRLKCSLELYTRPNVEAIRDDMQELRKQLSGGNLAFQVTGTQIFLTDGKAACAITENTSSIADVIKAVDSANNKYNEDEPNEGSKQKRPKAYAPTANAGNSYAERMADINEGALGCYYELIDINVLKSQTRDRPLTDANAAGNAGPLPALCMRVQCNESKFCIPLQVDSMAMLCKHTKVSRLYDVLIESLCRSLRLYEQTIVESLEESAEKQLSTPRIYHFFPEEFGHFLSCGYVDDISEDDAIMLEKRKKLHRYFGLTLARPYFRRANRCLFREDYAEPLPLINPHVGLRDSGVVDGKQYLVQGNYFYYHYLQQNMQDKGWGCAYRSLQTIFSWFQLQGYTELPVPTHAEIQQHLVDIGDKQRDFAGSKQWIGSTEVGMCLEGLLKVSSKIRHVASGKNLPELAPDLAMHFQSQGTPIMIGGGCLAHTIIGVDYNMATGKVKYLILDPHYTGNDDLQTVQMKGWCGWKDGSFWDKKSYYNLCMPQRPVMY